MNKTIFLIAGILAIIVTQQQVYAIYEDEILICVADLKTQVEGDLNCHIYPIDDIDWYQEINEPDYGKFGDYNDSFSIEQKD